MVAVHWTAFLGIFLWSIALFRLARWLWPRCTKRRIILYIVDPKEELVPLNPSDNPYWIMIDAERRKITANPTLVEKRKDEAYRIYLWREDGNGTLNPHEVYVDRKQVPVSDEKEYVFLQDPQAREGAQEEAIQAALPVEGAEREEESPSEPPAGDPIP